ncbi:MAG: hypothetical protein AAGB22_03740 [Bacteroidota bacterium]
MKRCFILLILMLVSVAQAQPPVSKRMQKKVDAWLRAEAEEAAYKDALNKADSLFRLKYYLASISAYEQAMEIRKKDAFSTAKINDLKILLEAGKITDITPEHMGGAPSQPAQPQQPVLQHEPKRDTMAETAAITRTAITSPAVAPAVPVAPEVVPEAGKPKPEPSSIPDTVKPKSLPNIPVQPKAAPKDVPKPAPRTAPKPQPKLAASRKASAKPANEERPPVETKTYDNGMTEEITRLKTKTITIRTVKKDGQTHVYKKIRHNWGGLYFFKDEFSISSRLWLEETEP